MPTINSKVVLQQNLTYPKPLSKNDNYAINACVTDYPLPITLTLLAVSCHLGMAGLRSGMNSPVMFPQYRPSFLAWQLMWLLQWIIQSCFLQNTADPVCCPLGIGGLQPLHHV